MQLIQAFTFLALAASTTALSWDHYKTPNAYSHCVAGCPPGAELFKPADDQGSRTPAQCYGKCRDRNGKAYSRSAHKKEQASKSGGATDDGKASTPKVNAKSGKVNHGGSCPEDKKMPFGGCAW